MPGCPPVFVETMRAMVVPEGYAPPVVQPDTPRPPQPDAIPEQPASPEDDDDEHQGDYVLNGRDRLWGV